MNIYPFSSFTAQEFPDAWFSFYYSHIWFDAGGDQTMMITFSSVFALYTPVKYAPKAAAIRLLWYAAIAADLISPTGLMQRATIPRMPRFLINDTIRVPPSLLSLDDIWPRLPGRNFIKWMQNDAHVKPFRGWGLLSSCRRYGPYAATALGRRNTAHLRD